MVCSLRCRRWRSASRRGGETTWGGGVGGSPGREAGLASRGWAAPDSGLPRDLRSTTRTSGRTPPPTRSGSSRRVYFPEWALAQALQRGGCRAENADGADPPGTHHRHVAGVVARGFGLLVAAIVFLVHDHRAERGHRREHSRAGPDRDALLAGPQLRPGVEALAVREPRMQDRDQVPECAAEAGDRLGRQRDLRDQHERAFAAPQHPANQLDVDQRLAGTRDAVQEEGPAPPPQRPHHAAEHPALTGGRGRRVLVAHRLLPEGIPHHHVVRHANEALRLQPPDHAPAESLLGQRRDRLPATRFEEPLEGFPLPPRPPEHTLKLREGADRPDDPRDEPPLRRSRGRRGQHGPKHHPDRRHVVLRNPPGEIEEFGADRWSRIEHGEDVAHTANLGARPQNPPRERAVAEGNPYTRPRRRGRTGNPVGEQAAQRQRQRHLHKGGARAGHRFGTGSRHRCGAGPGPRVSPSAGERRPAAARQPSPRGRSVPCGR